ncbi:Uncharacterized membrane protein [Microbacterium sp. ru370.1]|uniref:DUF1345 domain-containing protein n=1 Tax=unclassified Microbacterium TaxID=2609290 RepID=UPI000883BD91|nr:MULTISPECIES: DUF1345 domain-containing protein [unclassified Microbacterium]SDO76900.1 Uncharacterized membrane protein [Microbacterium sp. ru370.1]SIT88695.1 Uncharacterized membrane protein [Microbacterium sp. RU1D]
MSRQDPSAFRTRPEHRWPVLIALAVGAGLYAFLPTEAGGILRYVVVAAGVLCAIPMVVTNPSRLTRDSRLGRGFALAFTAVLLLANQVALVLLVHQLLQGQGDGAGTLLGAAQVWAINVIGYAVVYWEMDRGGPIARRRDAREELPPADFQFPQDSDRDAVSEVRRRSSDVEDWAPGYVDYLYFSASNAMAFSPTDVMPLSSRAKLFMMVQAVSGFILLALVIARSVNILN